MGLRTENQNIFYLNLEQKTKGKQMVDRGQRGAGQPPID